MDIKIYDINGENEKVFTLTLQEVKNEKAIAHVNYLVDKYQKAYIRQGTHSCKTRAEVTGTTAKPYKQKGTGRARRGTVKTPLRRGGGVIFGPKPRDYNMKVNKNLFKLSFNYILNEKRNELAVLSLEKDILIKTKDLNKTLSKINNKAKKTVIILHDENINLELASRNLKNVRVYLNSFISIEDLSNADSIILTEEAAIDIQKRVLA